MFAPARLRSATADNRIIERLRNAKKLKN